MQHIVDQMFCVTRGTTFIVFEIPSIPEQVGRVVSACGDFLRRRGLPESSAVTVVLRELLANAIEHGNRNVPARKVLARVQLVEGNKFELAVEDEGAGFDWHDLDTSLPQDPHHIHNRGMVLIDALSDRIEFNRKGNCVRACVSAN